jgi:hypothetical protein
MDNYNLCLAWNWKYDSDFVTLLANACFTKELSLLQATPGSLANILDSLFHQRLSFQVFFDRASDEDALYTPLVEWANKNSTYCINHYDKAFRTRNKAEMHYSLIQAGLQTPFTIILPSYLEQPNLMSIDLHELGLPFTIKPAHGGGGKGVITEARQLNQVLAVRQEYPGDQYLLQTNIVPRELDSRSAWFRVIYCTGEIYPCWWDRRTHFYTKVSSADDQNFRLFPLKEITMAIANLTGLDLFSTEIAFTIDGLFVVVDYVNDLLDMRLQSTAADGIPDEIVIDITRRLVTLAMDHL